MKEFSWRKLCQEERPMLLDSSWTMKSFPSTAFIAQTWNTIKPSTCSGIPEAICTFEFSEKSVDWSNRPFQWRPI
jgi:hypothetical protein